MNINNFIFGSLLCAIYMVTLTQGIKCWFCNSLLDPHCSDPFDNTTANTKDCAIAEELQHLPGIPARMCRKVRMKTNGHWRYSRDCAYLGEAGVGGDSRYCIYRSGTYNIHMEYCTCNDKDGCNSAPQSSIRINHLMTVLSASLVLVTMWLLRQ